MFVVSGAPRGLLVASTVIAKHRASITAPAVMPPCSVQMLNMTRARVGPAFTSRWIRPGLSAKLMAVTAWCATRFTAHAAVRIWVTYSMMGPGLLVSDFALILFRLSSSLEAVEAD